MNDEEKQYLVHLRKALDAKNYPAEAVQLIMGSDFAAHIIGDAWRNHVDLELSQSWFERRWLAGPMRCLWLWQPNMELENLPQDVSVRAEEAMKRRKKPESTAYSAPAGSGVFTGFSSYKKPSR